MKDFSTYIDENKLIYQFGENEILTEGILKRIADWLGGKAGGYVNKVNTFYDELINLPNNIIKAFNGTVISTSSKKNKKDSVDEKVRQEKMEEIIGDGKSKEQVVKNISKLAKENIDNEEFTKSPWVANLCASGYQLANEIGDTESAKVIKKLFDKIEDSAKKDALEIQNEAGDKNPLENTDKKEGDNNPSEEDVKKVEEIADNVINEPEIEQATKKANVDPEKLKSHLSDIILSQYQGSFEDIDDDESEKLVSGIAEIVLGAKSMNDTNFDKDILAKYGIDNIEEFLKNIMAETNK